MSFVPQPCESISLGSVEVANGPGEDAVNIQDGGNSITTDSLAEHIEDDPHVSGDTGVFILAVRNDAQAILTDADGDYSPIAVDSTGQVQVVVTNSSTLGAHLEDDPHVSGDAGDFILGVRNDNGTTDLTTTNGDYSPIATDIKGRAITTTSGSNLSNGTETAVSAAAVPLAGAPANAARKGLIIQNVGVGDVRIGIAGVTATTGMKLLPGDSIVLTGGAAPINALFAIRSGAADSIVLAQELN